ncbi:response regulator transcription factor [Clostridium thermobutyricum]|uniref:response regulator transcription factor n=1 Tax=Clostridium thermobutyricum TaxID=29372 RepID=UPI002942DFD6|nr:response regulator transcription factor [Clostridium thermobutyricum]
MRILLIEDDLKLREYVSEYLRAYDFESYVIKDFKDVIVEIDNINPDLILLDINLPEFDGFYFLKVIRKKYNIPIIITSAISEVGEQIRGMELGADDYITKPFPIGILIAKIKAIMRRKNEYNEENELIVNLNENEKIILENSSMKLLYKGKKLELAKNEHKILKLLIEKIGQVVTREELLETLWDETTFVDDNTLTVNVSRLKKKLEGIGLKNIISTKRSIGYVFNT